MRRTLTLLALALRAASLQAQTAPLTVLRHSPGDTARSTNVVTVTFDRPVAGRLDEAIDARRILHLEPAVSGRTEWRDPVTLRFVPDAPLSPGARFTVWVDTAFRAIDGSRLEEAYHFSFRVPGPRLLSRSFGANYAGSVGALPLDGRVLLLYSAPVEPATLSQRARVHLLACPAGVRSIPLRVTRQRTLAKDDPYEFQYALGWDRDTTTDRFIRVVELEPAEAIPTDCRGQVVLPTTTDDGQYGLEERYEIRTAPSFRFDMPACDRRWGCALDDINLHFTAPVARDSVLRHVHLEPAVPLVLDASASPLPSWRIRLHLRPRSTYTVVADSSLRDVDGRPLTGPHRMQVVTGDYHPAVAHETGSVVMPRSGPRTLPLRHVNVRTVRIVSYLLPEHARARAVAEVSWWADSTLLRLAKRADTAIVSLSAPYNVERTTEVPLPARLVAAGSGVAVLRIEPVEDMVSPEMEATIRSTGRAPFVVRASASVPPYMLVQLTDLAVHAKAGAQGGMVLVTGLGNGHPRAGVAVRQLDIDGNTVARGVTGRDGVAVLHAASVAAASTTPRGDVVARGQASASLMEAVLGGDRVVTPLIVRRLGYTPAPALDPARLGGRSEEPPPVTATLFADRGIFRPGEMLYLTGVLREGTLDALHVPTRGDSVRLTIRYRPRGWNSNEDVIVRDTVLRMTSFGTVSDSSRLRAGLPLGSYVAELSYHGFSVAEEELRVAEYRTPEFLVDARADSTPRFGGDTVRVDVAGRYLFGAPMGRAQLSWSALLHEVLPWEIHIPGAEGWTVGEWDGWRAPDERAPESREVGGTDSLDAGGHVVIRVPLDSLRPSRPGRVEISVAVADINRQAVTSTTSVPIHPARLYVLARKQSRGWYWTVGQRAAVEIRTVRPDGRSVTGVPVTVSLVRREWHWNGSGRWVETPMRTDTVRTGTAPALFSFVPTSGGVYELRLSAPDAHGSTARTTLSAYAIAAGSGWWAQTPYHLPLVTDPRTLAVGDSTRVLFDSPFDQAEAWVTIEREGVLEHRRMVVRRGPNVVPIRVAESYVPNVFVSVLLVRRTDAVGGARPDSAAQLVRLGYVELHVKTDRKRLKVAVEPMAREYGPGDTATLRLKVSDADGRPSRSEVTLWAVDEGVLALTGFETPDLISRLYVPRGLGAHVASTLTNILAGNPSLQLLLGRSIQIRGVSSALTLRLSEVVVTSTAESPAAASVAGDPVSLRRLFRSTAFYLGAAPTDANGRAELRSRLPDNLTTYRVMAVAVGADDHFGSGDTTLLVTRALVARPTLPRFVRASDTLLAGAAVNVRDGTARPATVEAGVDGLTLQGEPRRLIALQTGKGAEARFGFVVPPRDRAPDTVVVRLRASDGTNGDAVETRLPVQPDFHVRRHTAIGAARGRTEVLMPLPAGIDVARSRVTVRIGTSPLAPMLAAWDWLRVYPYQCTEQISSGGRALLAVWRATRDSQPKVLDGDPRARLQALADELARRQRADGAIKYWNDHEWSSPWLSTWAGLFLLEARDQGIVVEPAVLAGIARYLASAADTPIDTGGMNRYERRARRLALGGRVATVEFLRRSGHADEAAEDRLFAAAPLMTWEDRLRLAEAVASRHDPRSTALLDAAWATVARAGNRVDLPESAISEREFPSHVAPAARLLTATLALRPDHPLLGALVETVMQQGSAEGRWAWSTQDYASVVIALATLQAGDATPRDLRVEGAGRVLSSRRIGAADSVVSLPLDAMVERGAKGGARLRLVLTTDRVRAPVFYAVSVDEVPSKAPVTPDIQGITVERWYERFSDGRPVTSVREGDLVRVRLRITVPADREFVAVEDPLPAGLEAVDLSLRTSGSLQPFATRVSEAARAAGDRDAESPRAQSWLYGRWDEEGWSPWEHKAMHDDKVAYFARMLWKGSYSASYVARATTAGSFVRPPAHAEEMYNPSLQGRSDGGRFGVEEKRP